MPLTKKDFEGIAKVFAGIRAKNQMTTREYTLFCAIAVGIAEYLKHENSLFDRAKFLDAARALYEV